MQSSFTSASRSMSYNHVRTPPRVALSGCVGATNMNQGEAKARRAHGYGSTRAPYEPRHCGGV